MTREDAIAILKDIQNNQEEKNFLDRCALDMAIEALKDKRPHGEWIESKERKGHFYCSECVHQDASGKWRELFDYKYNYCPNCGASMVKEGEEK